MAMYGGVMYRGVIWQCMEGSRIEGSCGNVCACECTKHKHNHCNVETTFPVIPPCTYPHDPSSHKLTCTHSKQTIPIWSKA